MATMGPVAGNSPQRPHCALLPPETNQQDPAAETPHPAGSLPCLDAQHVAGASGQRGPFFPKGGTRPRMTVWLTRATEGNGALPDYSTPP